jgi:NTP pyrophosphatase (non-canonical NTP hydrolase)
VTKKYISKKEALAISKDVPENAEAEGKVPTEQKPFACEHDCMHDLGFKAYQEWARTTAIYPNVGKNLNYVTLGLCSESGEIAGKIKKLHRDANGIITPEFTKSVSKELGDTIWYIASLCSELGLDMSTVAMENMEKLNSRLLRGVLGGNGDNR